ncbi:hypothetical protein [Streptomyces griseorubiginosus]|uniref:hypothetical protein n=1 Tax=Streptomyces griseorubiginosus TaxID=67304 RepID=UPI00365B596A
MRVRRRSIALAGVGALLSLAAAGGAAQAASSSLTVTTLGRHGAKVATTRFLPTGLNSRNQAAANSTTTVDVSAGRGSQGPGLRFTKVTARAVKVWSSADGGKTWKAATVRRSGSSWQATVHNPASGAVALRSEVTDAAGDRSTQTVYRAYAIG